MMEEIVFWAKNFQYSKTTETHEASDGPKVSGIEAANSLLQLTGVKMNTAQMRKFIEGWTDPKVAEERIFDQKTINKIAFEIQQREYTIELIIIAIVFGATGRIFRSGTPFDQLGFTSTSAFEYYRLLVPPVMIAIQAQLNNDVVLHEIRTGIEAIQQTSAAEKKRFKGTLGSEILQEKNKAIDRVKDTGDEKIKE
ncbi:MAG: hypothetical protein NXI02_12420, partial [Rhodobacteraceae bacterium]|nr:hypothetical protein [Paracoccaceae bacterium]